MDPMGIYIYIYTVTNILTIHINLPVETISQDFMVAADFNPRPTDRAVRWNYVVPSALSMVK